MSTITSKNSTKGMDLTYYFNNLSSKLFSVSPPPARSEEICRFCLEEHENLCNSLQDSLKLNRGNEYKRCSDIKVLFNTGKQKHTLCKCLRITILFLI